MNALDTYLPSSDFCDFLIIPFFMPEILWRVKTTLSGPLNCTFPYHVSGSLFILKPFAYCYINILMQESLKILLHCCCRGFPRVEAMESGFRVHPVFLFRRIQGPCVCCINVCYYFRIAGFIYWQGWTQSCSPKYARKIAHPGGACLCLLGAGLQDRVSNEGWKVSVESLVSFCFLVISIYILHFSSYSILFCIYIYIYCAFEFYS